MHACVFKHAMQCVSLKAIRQGSLTHSDMFVALGSNLSFLLRTLMERGCMLPICIHVWIPQMLLIWQLQGQYLSRTSILVITQESDDRDFVLSIIKKRFIECWKWRWDNNATSVDYSGGTVLLGAMTSKWVLLIVKSALPSTKNNSEKTTTTTMTKLRPSPLPPPPPKNK